MIGLVLLASVAAACEDPQPVQEERPHSLSEPWSPTPFRLDPAQATVALNACRAGGADIVGVGTSPIVADARGGGRVQLLFASATTMFECSLKVERGSLVMGGGGGGTIGLGPPGPTDVFVNGLSTEGQDPQGAEPAASTITGRIGAQVGGVDVLLPGGQRIGASIGGGWFVAWWPGNANNVQVQPLDGAGQPIGTPHP